MIKLIITFRRSVAFVRVHVRRRSWSRHTTHVDVATLRERHGVCLIAAIFSMKLNYQPIETIKLNNSFVERTHLFLRKLNTLIRARAEKKSRRFTAKIAKKKK